MAMASAGQDATCLRGDKWEYWVHFLHRLVFPHHLVGADITAWLLSAASPSPSSPVGTCSYTVGEGGRRAAPPTYIASLKCFHLSADHSYMVLCPLFLTLSPYHHSSQAQEARHLAALRH